MTRRLGMTKRISSAGVATLAGLTVDSPTLHVDAANDRVEIGTSTINNRLEVNGAVSSSGGFKISNVERIDSGGFFRPTGSDDSSAFTNSIYYSTDQDKLCYKDPGGNVHALY